MWTLNGIQITVVDLKEEQAQIVAELQPLTSGTVFQFFGYENIRYPLQAFVVSMADKNSIENLAKTGVAYPLVGAGYSFGNFFVTKATFQWLPSYRQTFRPDKSDTDLVFRCNLDLVKE